MGIYRRPKKIDEVVSKPKQTKTLQVWKPKADQILKPHRIEASPALQEQKPKKMCLRALDIQIKLFGHTSILLPIKGWLKFVQNSKVIENYQHFLAH